uniref:Uncharacterized protein n=1 Tax=viral metagenome TaxID=1070528 RepID=A0A6H1ZUV7_9ZZZZ
MFKSGSGSSKIKPLRELSAKQLKRRHTLPRGTRIGYGLREFMEEFAKEIRENHKKKKGGENE